MGLLSDRTVLRSKMEGPCPDKFTLTYVVSEGGGEILKSDREVLGEYCFPREPVHEEKITFRNLSEYENVDLQGFRGDIYVKEAVIPEGASVIPKSQFFGCRSLEKLYLPESVSVIEDYAFALVLELKKSEKLETLVCVTGQHREMLKQVLDIFKVVPDYDLAIMKKGQDLTDVTTAILTGMREILKKEKPDIVLVHGDTSTAFAASLAAFYQQIPVGHVEAGLRTYNMKSPYPEEFNRQAIGLTASLHFAPTQKAADALLKEGKDPERIFITGNTGIDALHYTVRSDFYHPETEWAKGSRLIAVTAHRRENLGEPMRDMFRAIRRIVEEFADVKVIYPVHLNPQVRKIADEEFGGCERIHLIEPLDVVEFHNLMKASYLIMTDSGGIQEEAPALGKPVLVMRDTTERPEGVEAGTLKLVGTKMDDIYRECKLLLTEPETYRKMSEARNPYGDGTASIKIRKILEDIDA